MSKSNKKRPTSSSKFEFLRKNQISSPKKDSNHATQKSSSNLFKKKETSNFIKDTSYNTMKEDRSKRYLQKTSNSLIKSNDLSSPKSQPKEYNDPILKSRLSTDPPKPKETSRFQDPPEKSRISSASQSNPKQSLNKFQDLKDRKAKLFDVFDKEEELVISGSIDDLKREVLVKEFKTLFYKCKEIKELLTEFSDTCKTISNENATIKLELTNKTENLENIELKNRENEEKLEKIQENYNEKTREIENLRRENDENQNDLSNIREKLSFFQGETKKLIENERVFEETRFFANKKEAQIRVN